MGKGDKRTKRGKIFKGSFGKSRPKARQLRKLREQRLAAQASAQPESQG